MIAFALSPTMLMFAGGAAIVTGIAFGLFPALHSTRPDLAATLKNQAGQPGGAKAARRFRTTLATVQIAMSMALLVPAGLFAKSLFNVSRVDLGLKTDHMVLFSLAPELNSYTTERTRQLFERIEDEFAATPGVTSVVMAMVPVLAGDNWGNSLVVEGFEAGPDTNTNASFNGVGPGYFRTMGIPLMAGREFTRADAAGAPKVGDRQPGVREEVQSWREPGRQAVRPRRSERQARHRNRRHRPRCEIQRGQARGAATIFPAVSPGRAPRLRLLLHPHVNAARADAGQRPDDDAQARRQPAGRRREDDGDADSRECQRGSHHQHAVAGVCAAGDGPGGDRSLRRAGLHGGAAHARVRPAHGAWRRRRRSARPGDEAGGEDGGRSAARLA